MSQFAALTAKLKPLFERVDQLSLRERGLIFGAGVTLIYIAWQALLMDPITKRARAAEQRLVEVRRRGQVADEAGVAAAQDPAVAAAGRNQALQQRLREIDAELAAAAHGYLAPERMTELVRGLLAGQQGLRLISLRNLPAESLSRPASGGAEPSAATGTPPPSTPAGAQPASADRGPFLHPVELVVEGDYLSIVNYLHELEKLPWRIHWQRLDLLAGDYPSNRVRIVIGALSLSRDWMTV
jgi:MSHA biogenesis protein MshJ